MRLALALTFALLATNAHGQAPQADPVLSAYREYAAALKSNDIAAAETAAERAWRASEARSGDGGKTAVLAYNLADARIALGRGEAAVEPARRASSLADKGAAGVDATAARLLLGHALLSTNFVEAKAILKSAFDQVGAASPHARGLAYHAAVALGEAVRDKKDWELAREASDRAFEYADASGGDVEIARATALIGRGAAFVAQRRDREAIESFYQAMVRLAPLSPERDDDKMTLASLIYAQASGWAAAARARFVSERGPEAVTGSSLRYGATNPKEPPPFPPAGARPALVGKAPLCEMQLVKTPRVDYPNKSLNSYGVGGVVVRLKIDANGRAVERAVVASIPSPDFGDAVTHASGDWIVKAKDDSPAGCRLETSDLYQSVQFVLY